MGEHTPTPWVLVTSSDRMRAGIDGANGDAVVWNSDRKFDGDETGIPNDADAELIVRAVNAHDDLVAALRASKAALELQGFVGKGKHGAGDPEINTIDAALAKAEAAP